MVYRTHRARKATYVKALEDAVGELQKQNAACQDKIHQYHELLEQLGIPDPIYSVDAVSSNRLATINLLGDSLATQKLEARLPAAKAARSDPSACYTSTDSEMTGFSTASSTTSTDLSGLSNIPLPPDTTQIGINFILALEQPCLHHQNIPCPDLAAASMDEIPIDVDATGHASMMSTPLMDHSPFSTTDDPLYSAYPSDTQWTVPVSELENLLMYSQKLGLGDGEVTPVQAWQVVRGHEGLGRLGRGDLERLRDGLLPLVHCYGLVAFPRGRWLCC
jgi:hypothetical protein